MINIGEEMTNGRKRTYLHERFNLCFDTVHRGRLGLALCEEILLALSEFLLF